MDGWIRLDAIFHILHSTLPFFFRLELQAMSSPYLESFYPPRTYLFVRPSIVFVSVLLRVLSVRTFSEGVKQRSGSAVSMGVRSINT